MQIRSNIVASVPQVAAWPEVARALVERRPAIAAQGPIDLPAPTPGGLAGAFHLGQEITVVPEVFTRPIQVARAIAAAAGGEATELVANAKARVDSPLGVWIVEHDGKLPGGAPIIEVGTPPTRQANDAALLAVIDTVQQFGAPMASAGGGHIHVDGAPFLASPRLLSRFLQLYLHIEPALLSAFRHPARSHAARGVSELEQPAAIRASFQALAEVPAAKVHEAVGELIGAHALKREMALNLLSLTGVVGGNKKSKGTIELRFFDSPASATAAARQRDVVRKLIAAALGSAPLPAGATPIHDLDDALKYLEGQAPAKVPPGPWSVGA